MEEDCVFREEPLNDGQPVTELTPKGLATIKSVSKNREDGVFNKLKLVKVLSVHTQCRKDYTRRIPTKPKENVPPATPVSERRKKLRLFTFKKWCLFCEKVMKPWDKVSRVNTSPEFDLKLLATARERDDDWGYKIIGKVEAAGGTLQEKECRYHRSCFSRFQDPSSRQRPSTPKVAAAGKATPKCHALVPQKEVRAGRSSDAEKGEWFQGVCKHMEENADCQFSLKSLLDKFSEGERYGEKHLKRLLLQKYPSQLHFTTTHFTFTGTAAKLLDGEWHKKRLNNEKDERLRIVRMAATIVREDVRSPVFNCDEYPSLHSISTGGAEMIPDTLRQFVSDVIRTGKRGKDLTGVDRRCTAICQNVMVGTRPKSYLSPLHVGLAVDLHRRHASRSLLDTFSSIGSCSSYQEAIRFESSVVTTSQAEVTREVFSQYVLDNADFNIRTLTGHGTFHVMGIIMCVVPASGVDIETRIPRKGVSIHARYRERYGAIPVKVYRPSRTSGLELVNVRDLRPGEAQKAAFQAVEGLDLLWLAGRASSLSCPGWSGFMEVAAGTERPVDTSAVIPLPFINLQATNPSAIFTGLEFAAEQCKARGQTVCVVTFDQPLFQKAMEIVLSADKGTLLSTVVVRLGTFHLNMSFLLAIGKIMAGSGIEELLSTVYAKNSVVQMLAGKAYSRAVRGHFLAQAAVTDMLMESCSSAVRTRAVSAFKAVLNETIQWDDAAQSPDVEELRQEVKAAWRQKCCGGTPTLWHQYCEMVNLLKMSIAFERLGDWQNHLAAVQSMLPYFHSARCLNYAKSAHLYLQQMQDLETKMSPTEYYRYVTLGYFTVRNKNKAWSGNETDKIIEQKLLKELKSVGGLTRGRGLADSTLASWIHTAPVCFLVRAAVEMFTGTSVSTSEQHTDLRDRSKVKEKEHFMKFKSWLLAHNPFSQSSSELVALASGVVSDSSINCDTALRTGLEAMENMVGKKLSDLKLSRKACVRPLSFMSRRVAVGEDEILMPVSVNQLFHRIVVLLQACSEEEMRDTFSYELAPLPSALFDDDNFMRVGKKSSLVPVVESFCPSDSTMPPLPDFVVDGGYLLRVVVWPRFVPFSEIISGYCRFMTSHYKNAVVVFDGYEDGPQTKDEAHLRRGTTKSPEIVFVDSTVCTSSQADFLSNARNKVRLISHLTRSLCELGFSVIQAPADADTMIVTTALNLGENAVIVGNDSDLLAILAGTTTPAVCAHLLVPGTGSQPYKIHHSRKIIVALPEVANLVPFVHAMLGCDTNCTIFRRSKKQAIQKLIKLPSLRELVKVFNDSDATKDQIAKAGEVFILALYSVQDMRNLNEARLCLYRRYIKKQGLTQKFLIASLPPTTEAAKFHSFRVFHQVQAWRGVNLDPLEWGWKLVGRFLRPIPSQRAPAPERLLRNIYCTCRGRNGCDKHCNCRDHGVKCSQMCGYCSGAGCSNTDVTAPEGEDEQGSESEDPDDPGLTSEPDGDLDEDEDSDVSGKEYDGTEDEDEDSEDTTRTAQLS